MNHQPLSSRSGVLILLLFSIAFIPYPILAQPDTGLSEQTGDLFSGSIPSGDGIVSVKAASGKLYQIPAMSPLGVVQALAGTDSIDSYQIGDELIVKKGILTLDGINNLTYAGDNCWFVQVNNRQLEDYYLPTKDALNIFPLNNGDVVLFAYGNPTRPLSEAAATMSVTIGAQNTQTGPAAPGSTVPVSQVPTPVPIPSLTPVTTITATPVQTSVPIPAQTQISQTPEPTQASDRDPNQPVYEDEQQKSQQTSESDTSKDPNQPVYEDEQQQSQQTSESDISKDPNQPVYEDEQQQTQQTSESDTSKDPNQPVYEDEQQQSQQTSESDTSKDPNQPVYEDEQQQSQQTSESDNSKDPNQPIVEEEDTVDEQAVTSASDGEKESEDQTEEETEDVTPAPTSKAGSSGQDVIYDGSLSVPSGSINVTADSGVDYDISANTPVGLLQMLYNNGNINSLSVSDKGMSKGGILTIMSINEYQFGDNGWFAQINDNTLKDWANPGSDGLNIRTFGSGDRVTFYYGTIDQYPSSAKAVLYIDIE